MYLLWRVYYRSPKRVTDLFGRVCICCGGCTTFEVIMSVFIKCIDDITVQSAVIYLQCIHIGNRSVCI